MPASSPAAETQCTFVSQNDMRCRRHVWKQHEHHCVFHAAGRAQTQPPPERVLHALEQEVDLACQPQILHGLDFTGVNLSHELRLEQRTIRGPVRLSESQLRGVACCRTRFEGGVSMAIASIKEAADFDGAHFASIEAPGVQFGHEAYFGRCIFAGRALFSGSRFRGRAFFSQSAFLVAAEFKVCTFEQGVLFSDERPPPVHIHHSGEHAKLWLEAGRPTALEDGADFEESSFHGRSRFSHIKFSGNLSLRGCTVWDLKIDRLAPAGSWSLDLRELSVSELQEENPRIESCSLARAMLQGTNIKRLTLIDVRWAKRRRDSGHALWDEIRPRSPNDAWDEAGLQWLAETYRRLVLDCDARRDFERSESFHVGELEVHRWMRGLSFAGRFPRIAKFAPGMTSWIGRNFNAFNVYRLASFYGTSYWQAAWCMSATIALLGALVMASGLAPVGDTQRRPINYDLCVAGSRCTAGPFSEWLRDYGHALTYTMQLVTFQRERDYEPAGSGSVLFVGAGSLLIAAEASLLLLALRRKFRRA